jgi:hypothetical protein
MGCLSCIASSNREFLENFEEYRMKAFLWDDGTKAFFYT